MMTHKQVLVRMIALKSLRHPTPKQEDELDSLRDWLDRYEETQRMCARFDVENFLYDIDPDNAAEWEADVDG